MKKSLKILSVCLLAVVVILSLASCGVDYYTYTEWTLSEDERVISDGEKEYTLYSADLFADWSLNEDNLFIYYEDITLGYDDYDVMRSPECEEIIYLQNRYDYDEFLVFATEEGAKLLDSVIKDALTTFKLFDENDWTVCELPADKVAYLESNLGTDTEVATSKLSPSKREVIKVYDPESGLERAYGAIYNVDGIQHYVCYDGISDALVDKNGYFTDRDTLVTAKKLSSEQIDAMSSIRADMEYSEYKTVYEEPEFDEEAYNAYIEREQARSKAILLVIVAIFGIIMPLVPLIISLALSIKKKFNIGILDYALIAITAIWFISGIVVFIILLC